MSDFSQLLSCHIHSKDIKTYALAQYCGLDRSNMYKIINGKRKPSSRELVLKICKFMQLSHAEQKEMEQAYEITLIGHDTYYRRKAVIDFFNNFRLSKLNLPVLSELNTEILFEKGSVTLNTMAEVNRSLLYIISSEVKKSNGTIDLLVQPDCDFLMNILAAENYDCSQTTIRHIICLNNSTSESITYPNYNLHCLEKILPLYSNVDKYNCFYYYDHIDSKCSKFTLFPGGASAPNYGLATIIGTFIAVRTGTGIDAAVGVGLPVGLLAIQLEVVVRIVNNFVAHKMQSDNNEGKWKNMNRIAWVGPLLCSLQTIIPTVIVVCFGANVVNFILDVIPQWVTDGLSIAAGMLPVVGIGMLMRYMPVKKFLPFILIGFILSAYLSMPVLGIAIVGFAAAFWYFTTEMKKAAEAEKAVAVTTVDEMGDDFDE